MSKPARTIRPAIVAPVSPVIDRGGLEIRFIWRYIAVGALMAACALFSAWSRVDLVETAVALDQTRDRFARASAEQERLQLELASLTDPHALRVAGESLAFDATVSIIDVR